MQRTFTINIISPNGKVTNFKPKETSVSIKGFFRPKKDEIKKEENDYNTGLEDLSKLMPRKKSLFSYFTDTAEEKAARHLLKYLIDPSKYKNTFSEAEYETLSQGALKKSIDLMKPYLMKIARTPINKINLLKAKKRPSFTTIKIG